MIISVLGKSIHEQFPHGSGTQLAAHFFLIIKAQRAAAHKKAHGRPARSVSARHRTFRRAQDNEHPKKPDNIIEVVTQAAAAIN